MERMKKELRTSKKNRLKTTKKNNLMRRLDKLEIKLKLMTSMVDGRDKF